MILPVPIFIRTVCEREKDEFPFEPKAARKMYREYRSMLKRFCSQHGLHELVDQMTTDPWSPWFHYICRTEKRKFLGIIPYEQEVAVAEVESQPRFAERDIDIPGQDFSGLEIMVLKKDCRPIMKEFCNQYSQRFEEKPKLRQYRE